MVLRPYPASQRHRAAAGFRVYRDVREGVDRRLIPAGTGATAALGGRVTAGNLRQEGSG
jgi:hypothetical protein